MSTVLVFLFASKLPAQDLRDPQFMERAQAGFKDIFNMDYDKARQVFIALEKEYPQHPAPPLYLASILWLEELLRRQDLSMNRFIAASYFSKKTNQVMPHQERLAFFNAMQKSQDLSNGILQRDPKDKDALYFLATYYGLRSAFAITIDHSLRQAFSDGNKAYSYSKELIKEDANYYDAYLAMGIYEYIAGSIPWYMKWLTFIIGVHGDKQEGLAHVRLASENGQYVRNEAKLVLMILDVRGNRYAEALEIARHLNSRFPRNFLFALNLAQILKQDGHEDQAVDLLLDVEKRAEAGQPNFDKLSLPTFQFNLGTELMNLGKLDLAQEMFQKCSNDPKTPAKEMALSHLNLGQILDSKGQRSEAIREYETVLSLEDFENSHSRATQLLRKLKSQ